MTHRKELVAVDVEQAISDVVQLAIEEKYSRMPVYQDNIDNIIGVLNAKDLLELIGCPDISGYSVKRFLREALFVPETAKCDDVLSEMSRKKAQMAIVVDEYGGTAGVVCMEDILEELVGEIWDEHDEVEEDFEKLDENTYRVDCSVSLEDFTEFFDIKLESDSVSVGGWVMEQLNRVPTKGDSFVVQNLEITVSDLSAYRVSFITVRQCGACLTSAQ